MRKIVLIIICVAPFLSGCRYFQPLESVQESDSYQFDTENPEDSTSLTTADADTLS